MAGKRQQEECRLTNAQQEKLIQLHHNESDPVLPNPRKVLLYTKQYISASHNN